MPETLGASLSINNRLVLWALEKHKWTYSETRSHGEDDKAQIDLQRDLNSKQLISTRDIKSPG